MSYTQLATCSPLRLGRVLPRMMPIRVMGPPALGRAACGLNGLYPGYYSGRRVDPVDRLILPLGAQHAERADAARNRVHLLATAREMLAEQGADKLTRDGLAERARLGKGTVFRRFGTRAGIFQALLDDDERAFQKRVMSGSPPLGPGAAPLDRLIAYGQARIEFLVAHRDIARATLDGGQPMPFRAQSPLF